MENEIVEIQSSKNEIMVTREPAVILAEAKKAAQALMTVVAQKKKPVIFNNEQYLEFEDWQTVGKFYGLSVKVIKTTFIELGGVHGYEASADVIRLSDGMVVSSAEAMCLNDEDNWSVRTKYEWKDGKKTKAGDIPVPLFQLRSMAQTRACSKAFRNVLAWVVVLAGFKPTPAEEMTGNEHSFSASVKPAVAMPKERPAPAPLAEDESPLLPDEEVPEEEAPPRATENKPSNPISLPQGKRLFAIYRHNGWVDEDVREFLQKNFGISSSKEIEREFYDDIVAHFSKPKNG